MAATKKRQKQLNKARLDKQRKAKQAANNSQLLRQPADPQTEIVSVNMDNMLAAVVNRDPRAWDALMDFMGYFNDHHYSQFGTSTIKKLNEFVACLSAAVATEGFNPSLDQAVKLTQMNHLIQHLFASSCYRTTDSLLDVSLALQGNVPRLMALMNPRSEIQLNQSKLFDIDTTLASLWFNSYILGISSPTERI